MKDHVCRLNLDAEASEIQCLMLHKTHFAAGVHGAHVDANDGSLLR